MNYQDRIDKLNEAGTADNTIKTYKKAEKYFTGWAMIAKNIKKIDYPIHEDLIIEFVLDHIEGLPTNIDKKLINAGIKKSSGKHSISTIRTKIEGLGYWHKQKNMENPCRSDKLRQIFTKARNIESKSGRIKKQSLPITKPVLDKMIKKIDIKTLKGKRDQAILEFGFYTGGRRRSEIANAQFRFLSRVSGGYEYLLHRSKTDQAGKGNKTILRNRYAKALTLWIKAAEIKDGYLFRSIQAGKVTKDKISAHHINQIIKDYIEQIGEDPKKYSAHGLRRGFITYCARKGIPIFDVMQLTTHKTVSTVQEYYKPGEISKNPATKI